MSKKRKRPGRQGGGRYTPPATRPAARSVLLPAAAAFAGADDDLDWDDDETDDDRWPVTIPLPRYGNRTVPHAFASWVATEGLTDQFDALMCERHAQGVDGDPLEAFVTDRDDVPPDVIEAIAGFDEYLDQLFGPPVE